MSAIVVAGCNRTSPPPAAQAGPTTSSAKFDYTLVKIEARDSMFRTCVSIYPSTNQWPVGDAADLLNQVSPFGWQESWISGDGRQVLVKRPSTGSGMGSIIASDVIK